MNSRLDAALCRQLQSYVETLTHTGLKTLDAGVMKNIKKICKLADGYVEHTYHLLLHQLELQHSEVRYSAFQIIDELFRRSHCFRQLLVAGLPHVLELAAETSPEHVLPPPQASARALRHLALRCVHEWDQQFGPGYRQLHIGYNFLRKCKKVDFNSLQLANSAQRARQEERNRRQEAVNQEKLKRALAEFNESRTEIQKTITEMESCLSLLIPSLDDFFIQDDAQMEEVATGQLSVHAHDDRSDDDSDSEDGEGNTGIREHGMLNSKYSVQVQLKPVPKVQETPENAAVLENARDLIRLMQNRYLPNVKKWIQITSKCSGSSDNIKAMVALKVSLEGGLQKCGRVGLDLRHLQTDSSDSDLEEVPDKDGFEESVQSSPVQAGPAVARAGGGEATAAFAWSIWSRENHARDPTTLQSTLVNLNSGKNQEKVSSAVGVSCELTEKKAKGDVKDKRAKGIDKRPSIFKERLSEPQPSTSKAGLFEPQPSTSKAGLSEPQPSTSKAGLSEPQPSTSKAGLSEPQPSTSKTALAEPEPSTSRAEDSAACESGEALSRKEKLLAMAPKLPFDVDLYHWGEEDLKAPTLLSVRAEGSRFWSAVSPDDLEEVEVPEGVASLRTRVIEFSGQAEPVRWACRAPLPSGRLCPRRDRFKCPLHGPIVGRDEAGRCMHPVDEDRLRRWAEQHRPAEPPDWQDPALLRDIQEVTGVDLKIPEKGKRRKKKNESQKYPGLTDLKAKQNNAHTRLAKKIFKKGAMKRIAQQLDSADHKRFRDKYGDQFQYVHETA